MPAEQVPVITNERSPFATTSTVPPHVEEVPQPPVAPEIAPEPGFATWNPEPAPPTGPGYSWDAAPPQNTAVPVDDEMIARLMEDSEPSNGNVAAPEPESTYPTYYQPARDGNSAPRTTAGEAAASVDHLLKLARELEYGLMELGESPEAVERVDSRLLANVLSDLQDDDELAPLRAAVATAQERPRDVDVMLDLVLRADAIAAVLTERDQLRSAISLFLENTDSAASDGAADEAEQVDVLDANARADVEDESEIDSEDVVSDSELDESVDEDSGVDSVETDSGDETDEPRSI